MSGLAQGGYRNISINYKITSPATTAPAAPLDFYKAVNARVQELEYLYNKKPAQVSNLTDVTTYFSGRTPYRTYKAVISFVKATGVYIVDFKGDFSSIEAAQAAS